MDGVSVRQLAVSVAFEFDGKSLQFRCAYVTMMSNGLFMRIMDADDRHIRFKLSDDPIMSKHELFHAMVSIKEQYPLNRENKMDIERIIEALRDSARRETKLNDNDQIYRLIEAADKCRKEVVLCLLGKPGIGKTEAVERFAKDHGRDVVHIIASQILPSEVSGMTMPNQDTHSMDIFDHYRLSHMKDGDILFFDELLKGQQQVLNACLTLIQERRLMSGTKLPDVLVIAAANPLATPLQLPLEIRQRFMFVNVEWNRLQWCDYMKSLGFDDRDSVKALSCLIERKMQEDAGWNTMTPRTATKLCTWLRDSECSQAVKEYITTEYGGDVLKLIKDAACGADVKPAEVQAAEKVIEVLAPMYNDPDLESPADALVEAMTAAQEVAKGTGTDMVELLDKLQALPEWGEIQKALAASEIEEEKIEF